jgi:hypothetical protein
MPFEPDPSEEDPPGLRRSGRFIGGSSIGSGVSFRKAGTPAHPADHLVGYLIVLATDEQDACALLAGNPVYEAGGTVEVRGLVQD